MATHSSSLPEKFHGQRSLASMAYAHAAKSLQSCPTLCDPIDGRPLEACHSVRDMVLKQIDFKQDLTLSFISNLTWNKFLTQFLTWAALSVEMGKPVAYFRELQESNE